MSNEIWKDVKGYEGYYEVSNEGRIRSVPRDGTKGRLLKFQKSRTGYIKLTLSKNGIKNQLYVHIIVATAFHPNPENKPCVNHKDGIKSNNPSENLEWCTRSENVIHAIQNNLRKRSYTPLGEKHFNSKLTERIVREIRNSEERDIKLATKYSVSKSCISGVRRKNSWKHV